jgi:DNA-directed RNA polymerase subunit beta'
MRAIDIAVSEALPEDLRQDTYNLDKKGLATLMARVATSHPDKFAEVAKRLGDLGRHAAYQQGYTISDKDMDPVLDRKQMFTKMDAEIKALRKQKLTPAEFADRRDEIFMQYADVMEKETMKAALGRNNSWATAAASGARGNAAHIRAILTTPGLFADTKGRVIPLFVRNSYSDGVRPAELLAGSYGARLSVVSTKTATAKGGDFGKQLVQNASNYNITEQDCGTDNGIDLDAADTSLVGRVMLSGEAIDRQNLADIRKTNKPVIVRSPLTCKSRHGLCAKCAGLQADGKFPQVGDSIGVTAATAIREPIVQGSLNTKHNAGTAKGQREFAGFDYINQFVQIPDEFKDKATVSETDGDVERIEPAAQGGHYVTVNGVQHYTLPGFELRVKAGDRIEAGELLSDGLANPSDIVRLRGLGEGRKYYADRLQQMLKESGYPADRVNLEIIAKSAVDNYRIEDPEDEDMLPDSLMRENEFMAKYKPATDTKDEAPISAVGGYLQKPVLHYTTGTKVTPKIAERISGVGVKQIPVSRKEPWFKSDMVRLRAAAHDSDDWLRSMGTSYLSKQLQQSVEAGEDTNVSENYHYGPRLAYGVDAGSGGFGEKVKETGMF